MLLVQTQHQRQIVAQCCQRAADAGVRRGMPLTQARALFGSGQVRIEPYDAPADQAALYRLAIWAQWISPAVGLDEASDGLLLDVTGCEHLFDGEDRLARLALQGLRRLGMLARVAIAPSIGTAWALSRYGDERCAVVSQTDVRRMLAPLPVAALRIGADVVDQLGHVGIERIGHLLDMPRSALPARFGDELLLRLDQALGQAIEVLEPVRPAAPPTAERIFDGPTDQIEAITGTVRTLVEQVTDELEQRCCGARSLRVELVRSDLAPEHLTITLSRPSRHAGHLWSMLHPKLEQAHLGFGVEAVRVRVLTLGLIRHEQARCDGADDSFNNTDLVRSCDEMLDTLSNRLGQKRVLRAELYGSHLPERSFVMSAAITPARAATEQAVRTDRPTVLFHRPVPAEVIALTPDGPVHRVSWNGENLAVLCCIGPERIGAEWWRFRGTTRDYFAAHTEDGRWLWLVRTIESGRWFVHGVWA